MEEEPRLVLVVGWGFFCYLFCFFFLNTTRCGCCGLMNPDLILHYIFHTYNEFVSFFHAESCLSFSRALSVQNDV